MTKLINLMVDFKFVGVQVLSLLT